MNIQGEKKELVKEVKKYKHFNVDIRNYNNLKKIFNKYKKNIKIIIISWMDP